MRQNQIKFVKRNSRKSCVCNVAASMFHRPSRFLNGNSWLNFRFHVDRDFGRARVPQPLSSAFLSLSSSLPAVAVHDQQCEPRPTCDRQPSNATASRAWPHDRQPPAPSSAVSAAAVSWLWYSSVENVHL